MVAWTLHRRLWTATCIRAGGRKPGALLVRQFLLGRRPVRLQHRRGLELGRRSDRDLRGPRPPLLVSRIQPALRHLRSRRISGRVNLVTGSVGAAANPVVSGWPDRKSAAYG